MRLTRWIVLNKYKNILASSFLDTEVAQIIENIPRGRQGLIYPGQARLLLPMTWLLASPGHQQPWYWPSSHRVLWYSQGMSSTHLGQLSHIYVAKNSSRFPSDAYMHHKFLYFSYSPRGSLEKKYQAKMSYWQTTVTESNKLAKWTSIQMASMIMHCFK